MPPLLTIRLETIRKNVATVRALCAEHHIDITGVTKVFCAQPEIARIYLEAGITRLGDSRVENLKRLAELQAEKWLIRMPMLSEIAETVRFADCSLNSEWATIQALNGEAKRQQKQHKVILMADLGDIREGFVDYDDLLQVAERTARLPNIELYGIGTNLSCFSFVHPDTEKLLQLQELATRLPMQGAPVVTGGNSASLHLMLQNGVPEGITNFRLGESLLFGKERCCYTYLPGTNSDAFILDAEIIELKEKPSLPWGEVGVDSYGNYPKTPVDRGIRQKAVLALGKQDCDLETLRPVDTGIEILGASSDHMILDITDSPRAYRVGDTISLELGYFSLLRAFTSRYVQKRFI